ncbi:30S ribosomal protein S11, chloroplastic [Turnera subulata]|uniref:30S ribosomal protein S11, chloroplastic n=1 Tax=Turnera subulata TaxID=218843 RepID=A0A9Q0JEL8_9ROSI|nr:30S ribosomal protein S11, chloroplastic [Turnera subulata]
MVAVKESWVEEEPFHSSMMRCEDEDEGDDPIISSFSFSGAKKRTPFAAKTAAEDAVQTVMAQGMRRAQVMVKGAGRGRNAALKAIAISGLRIRFFRDVTPLPHNGCRPPKRRRL